MYLNGAGIGMDHIQVLRRQTRKVQRVEPTACYGAVHSVATSATVVLPVVSTAASLSTATAAAAFVASRNEIVI